MTKKENLECLAGLWHVIHLHHVPGCMQYVWVPDVNHNINRLLLIVSCLAHALPNGNDSKCGILHLQIARVKSEMESKVKSSRKVKRTSWGPFRVLLILLLQKVEWKEKVTKKWHKSGSKVNLEYHYYRHMLSGKTHAAEWCQWLAMYTGHVGLTTFVILFTVFFLGAGLKVALFNYFLFHFYIIFLPKWQK